MPKVSSFKPKAETRLSQNVAYILSSVNARNIVRDMILPQLEANEHLANVVGMFFVFHNTYLLLDNTELGHRVNNLIEKNDMLVLVCNQCVEEREIEDKLIAKAHIASPPQLYGSLNQMDLDQVITI